MEDNQQLIARPSHGQALNTTYAIPALSPMEVFNLPLVNGFFLIDTRPKELYQQAKILLSMNCPPDTPSESIVASLRASWEEIGPDVYDLIVIYDHTELTEHSRRVIAACDPDALESIGLVRNARIVTIAGGYLNFETEYPLLCDHPAWGHSAYNSPLPRQLTPFIFQGYCVHAIPDILNGLKIKRVINMTKSMDSCPHFLFDPHKFSVAYLKCPTETISTQDMPQYFISMWQFIKEGMETGEKTLVIHCENERAPTFHCLAIVAAFLMIENRWRYEQAATYIKAIRPWEHRFAFIEELMLPEHQIFEAKALPSNQ